MANPIKYTTATQSNSIKAGNFAIGVNKGGYGPTNITNFYNGKTPNVGGYTVYVSNGSGSPSIFVAGNDAALITLSNQLGASNLLYDNGVINWTIGALTINVSRTVVTDNLRYRIISTTFISPFTYGNFRMFIPLSKLVNAQTYTLSYKWKYIVGSSGFSVNDWCDNTLFNVVNTTYVDYSFTSASGIRTVYDNVYRFMDFNIAQNTTIEIWDVQLEQKDFSTPFISNSSISTVTDALNWFNSSTKILCTNMDYPNIVTSGLVLNLDAGYTPSYPRTGTTWTDISGSGYTSTLVNGVSYGSNTLSFDGSDDAVTLPLSITLDGGNNWSVCMWVSAGVFSSLGYGTLLSNNSGGPVSNAFGMINGRISYDYYTSTWNQQLGNTTLTAGPWYFLTWVNSSPGKMLMYVNGVVDCALFNGNSGQSNPVNSIGRNWTTTFNGKILGVSIYKGKSLTPAEILQNYYAGLQRFIPTDSLVLSLDGSNTNKQVATASTAYDMSGNNNNGTLNNGVALVSDGQRSFSFDGTNDYISLNNTILQDSAGTISVWTKVITNSDNKFVINALGSGTNRFYIRQNNPGNFQLIRGANVAITIPTYTLGIWYNITMTWDSANFYAYSNGTFIGSLGYTSGGGNPTTIYIGSADTSTNFYNGYVGQLSIYTRALTATEVSTIYNTTKSRYGL